MMNGSCPQITYLVDPRFPGGTSSALAEELKVISAICRPHLRGLKSSMFKGGHVSRQLQEACEETHVPFSWSGQTITSDVIIIQNPAFLKFQETMGIKLLAKTIIVVTHENFYRPTGEPAFDIDTVLDAIDDASIACKKILAPISPYNRSTVECWVQSKGETVWSVLPLDWFNICDFDVQKPTEEPRDRRGRLSRAGHEKFPSLASLDQSFPASAESCVLLGADNFIPFGIDRPHWELHPFGSMLVDTFFDEIDFMVYHTSPTWRESFGRVIAESIAAGKVVITDAETAANFDGGVVHADPKDVSAHIEHIIGNPGRYQSIVAEGQKALSRYSAQNFRDFLTCVMADVSEWNAA
jgi:hypothetical protein